MRTFLILLIVTAQSQSFAQKAKIINIDSLVTMIRVDKIKKIHVFNFWATWCGPCVKELPLFDKLSESRKDVSVVLVSMDLDLDPDPAKVWRFVERRKIKSTVCLLEAGNAELWIDRIEKSWTGALPATLLINTSTGKRQFIEHALLDGELETLIEKIN